MRLILLVILLSVIIGCDLHRDNIGKWCTNKLTDKRALISSYNGYGDWYCVYFKAKGKISIQAESYSNFENWCYYQVKDINDEEIKVEK